MENITVLSVLNAHYPQNFTNLEFLRDSGCYTYAAFTAQEKFFVRVVKPAFLDTATAGLTVQYFLQEKGVPVAPVLRTKDDALCVRFSTADEDYLLIVCDWLDGSEPDPDADAEALGALVGRLHQAMQNYPYALLSRGKEYYILRYLDQMRRKNYPRVAEFAEIGEELWQKLLFLPRGPIHSDLYSGNFLKTAEGTIYLLDFDTFSEGIQLYDPALICNRTDFFKLDPTDFAKTKAAFTHFLPQYRQYASLPDAEANALYDVIALYHFALQATILEVFGLDCVDDAFLDRQLDWLKTWRTFY